MKYKIHLRSKGRQHWWRVLSSNGKILLTSETYKRPSTRTRVAQAFAKATGIKLWVGLRLLAFILLLAGCAAPAPAPKRARASLVLPPMPPSVRPTDATPQQLPGSLTWEYDLPLPRDVVFVIQRAPTVDGPWTVFGETNQPPFRVIPSGFYRIETRNL